MIRIQNQVIDAVKMKWDGITFPLKAGTPINKGGNVANNKTAIGIVMQNVNVNPKTTDFLYILVGGDVLLEEVEKSAGITLTKDAKASMSAIRFHLPNGKVDDSADEDTDTKYTLPAATKTTLGGVKMAANVAASEAEELATLVSAFNDLLDALKDAGIMEEDEQ